MLRHVTHFNCSSTNLEECIIILSECLKDARNQTQQVFILKRWTGKEVYETQVLFYYQRRVEYVLCIEQLTAVK